MVPRKSRPTAGNAGPAQQKNYVRNVVKHTKSSTSLSVTSDEALRGAVPEAQLLSQSPEMARIAVPEKKGKKSQLRTFRRSHSVSTTQLEKIQTTFPDWNFEFGNERFHDHPLGATERAVCESIAIELIGRQFGDVSITDIGGNANRHAHAGRMHVHSCNPILSSNDVLRRSRYDKKANFCEENSLNCRFVPDVYLSVHSLYYLSQQELLELVYRSRKQRLFAVVHRFDKLYGTYHDNGDFVESAYETFVDDDKVLIKMKVTGNPTSYTHPTLSWLDTTMYRHRNRAICWTGRPYGDSWIYEFAVVPEKHVDSLSYDRLLPMSLTGSLKRNDHHGNVSGIVSLGDEGSFKPMLTALKLTESKIRSCGNFLWMSHRLDKTILLPKDIIETVAVKMVNVPRDKAGLRLCINTMKQLVRPEKMSIPAKMRLDCCIYGAALAFVLCLKDEICVFNQLCTPRYKKLYSSLASVMSLESVTPSFGCCFPFLMSDREFNATFEAYEEDRSSAPGPAFDAKLAWPMGLPGVESRKKLAEKRPGSALSKGSREETEDKPQFHAVCTTFSDYIPVVPYCSVNNETVCVNNRALMRVDEPNAGMWEALLRFADRYVDEFTPVCPDLEGDFSRWNERFPKGKRNNQALAWESLRDEPLSKADFTRKTFAKRELTMKGGPVYEDFDPRAIQANSDRLNCSLGPFTHAVSKQLKELWHASSNVCYTAGMTAEEIGAWRSQFGGEDVTLLEMDESRYDAHQGEGCYRLFEKLLEKCGGGEYGDAMLAYTSMKRIQGWTSHGVKYQVDYTMTSGSPTTSCSNSFLNGVKTVFILERLGFKDYKILVHGDDNLVVLPGHLDIIRKRNLHGAVLAMNKLLGFETKLKIEEEWALVEYCSSLFWPVEDGYVLGPKIGKRLPKMGFSLRDLSPGEVKGMLLGAHCEMAHIPVLRVYVKHQLGLLNKVAKLAYHDDRAIYKSLATENHTSTTETAFFFLTRYGYAPGEAEDLLRASLTNNITDCVSYPMMSLFTAIDL